MTRNPHLTPQLDAFYKLETPGFAVMVNAPWGAGKSHAVKTWREDKAHLYVSLFGVTDAKSVEEALFQAALERDGGKDTSKVAQAVSKANKAILDFASKLTGATIDLSAVYRSAVLKLMPKLIVIDDLERAQMPIAQLLATINRLVEHQGKSVILIANEAELDRSFASAEKEGTNPAPSEYKRWREKIVGRTITLMPEIDLALDAFLKSQNASTATTFLSSSRDLIRQVFECSGTNNLRLLRQSLLEFAGFYDRIPEVYLSQTIPMQGLLAEYLALSLAFHAGNQLVLKDFRPFNELDGLFDDSKPKTSNLGKLSDLYKGLSHVELSGRQLPMDLAALCIVKGHATDDEIASNLINADAFKQSVHETWRDLWYWQYSESAQVKANLASVEADLQNNAFLDPKRILHVFGILLGLAERGIGGQSLLERKAQALTYIDTIEPQLIPFGSAREVNRAFDFGGSYGLSYAAADTPAFNEILDTLISALNRRWEQTAANRLRALLDLYAALGNPNDVTKDTQNSFYGVLDNDDPFFLSGDPKTVASEVFAQHPKMWSAFLAQIERRVLRQEQQHHPTKANGSSERVWWQDFRTNATNLANETDDPIRKAQILRVIVGYMDFLDTNQQLPTIHHLGADTDP